MKKDDSFKKPGSVPFKWEIRPGVPKIQDPQPQPDNHFFDFEFQKVQPKKKEVQVQQKKQPSSFPKTPPKLKPPPAGLYFQPQTRLFGSSPSSRSHRFGLPGRIQPDVVDSIGCFPSPLPKRKYQKGRRDTSSESEPDFYSDLDFSSRWSVSSRKSFSSLASCQSSPRPVSDAEWATFGLF